MLLTNQEFTWKCRKLWETQFKGLCTPDATWRKWRKMEHNWIKLTKKKFQNFFFQKHVLMIGCCFCIFCKLRPEDFILPLLSIQNRWLFLIQKFWVWATCTDVSATSGQTEQQHCLSQRLRSHHRQPQKCNIYFCQKDNDSNGHGIIMDVTFFAEMLCLVGKCYQCKSFGERNQSRYFTHSHTHCER